MGALLNLDDAWEKLRWAEHHMEMLRCQIEPFEERDAHTFSVEVNVNQGEYTVYVHNLELVDPDWGLMIGDCIHNARTALDYAMVRLWALITGRKPRDIGGIAFPIYAPDPDNPDADAALAAARKQFASAVGEMRKEPLFSGYLARIEELQPFNRWNPSVWGHGKGIMPPATPLPNSLARLAALDNIDKHRVPHVAWAGIDVLAGLAEPSFDSLAPESFTWLGGAGATYAPLENDAPIGTWRFQTPLPEEWEPSDMDMKRCFPLRVSFGDVRPFNGVLEVLPLCVWAAEAVLSIFDPVFKAGEPPLPVTAIANPGV